MIFHLPFLFKPIIMKSHFLFLLFFSTLYFGCNTNTDVTSEINAELTTNDMNINLAYEVFVQSFCDSNNDGIGDIKGLTSKLDYIKELGADAVWLMPIMPSPSYHKYDVTDYKGIHLDYGTMDDFKAFVEESHSKGIKIIIDFIINHTSDKHPWFLDAKMGPNAKYRDYYVWGDRDSIADNLSKKEISFDSDNITQWHAVDGDTTNHQYYYGFFNGGMPDLNFDNPKVRQEIYDLGKYWLNEVGVDGFRMDAAKHIYPDDRAEDNARFWKEFKQEMKKINPNVYIVGEIWSDAVFQSQFAPGFSSLFNFDLAFSILESVKKESPVTATIAGHGWNTDTTKSFVSTLIEKDSLFKSHNSEYVDAIFLSNHDQNRYMSVLDNDISSAKLAANILFTLPGIPYLYYGEEIGMRGMKPDENIREPFLWDAKNNDSNRTSWIEAVYTTDETVSPVSQQMRSPESMLSHYKELSSFRKDNEHLFNGELNVLDLENSSILAYSFTKDSETLYIIHNLSKEPTNITLPSSDKLILGRQEWNDNSDVWHIPAQQSVILKVIE